MLSLDLSKRLKSAGLLWEPKKGDTYVDYDDKTVRHVVRNKIAWSELYIFLPSLSQLLAEIEGRGYRWELNSPRKGIARLLPYKCYVNNHKELESKACWADSVEDAAAAALLWILEREKFETAETQKIEALDKLSSALRKAGVWNE